MHFSKLTAASGGLRSALLAAGVVIAALTHTASAGTVGFTFSDGDAYPQYNLGIGGTNQLQVEVDVVDDSSVTFSFLNLLKADSLASSILNVYIQDASGLLGGLAQLTNDWDEYGNQLTDFALDGAKNPQGSIKNYLFVAEDAGADSGMGGKDGYDKGINPDEAIQILFNTNGRDPAVTLSRVNAALAAGDIAFGLAVQRIGPDGEPSQQYLSVPPPTNVVPTPAAALGGLVLLGTAALRRRA